MINVRLIRPTKLKGLQQGELFLPVTGNRDKFLIGLVNTFEVALTLDGEQPFSCSGIENWSRGAGMAITDLQFEVDPRTSAIATSYTDATAGDLVVDGDRLAVIGVEKHRRYPIWLRGDATRDVEDGVAFSAWQITIGQGVDKQMLFAKSASTGKV